MRRKPPEPEEPGCPLWMMTFGDAVSLLVTFFVMLVSFASFEEHTLLDFFGAMQGGLRAVPVPMATMVGRSPSEVEEGDEGDSAIDDTDAVESENEGSQEVDDSSSGNIVWLGSHDYYLHLLQNGISLVIRESSIFRAGTAEILSKESTVWRVAADLMSQVNSEIRVEVTLPENAMVRSKDFSTPWGLAIEQSVAVRELLVDHYQGELGQMSCSVRVVKNMSGVKGFTGVVEIRFIGLSHLQVENVPRHIIRGMWHESSDEDEENDDG